MSVLMLNALKIVREIINLSFLVVSVFMAVPGLYRLMLLLQRGKFVDLTSSLLTMWLAVAFFQTFFGCLFTQCRPSVSLWFALSLFLTLIFGLDFLANPGTCFLLFGSWLILLVAVGVISFVKKYIKAKAQALV
jgi:hypothetical protein